MAMCDGTTLNIDDVGWQSELLHDCKRDCGERLIDFDPLHVADTPAGARQGLFDGGGGPRAGKNRLSCGAAAHHQARHPGAGPPLPPRTPLPHPTPPPAPAVSWGPAHG